jgi:uncharacterized RmlC-like cupin family protein
MTSPIPDDMERQLTDRDGPIAVIHSGDLAGHDAQDFIAQRLAAITHLPTGASSGGSEILTIPAGATGRSTVAAASTTLLHVIAGELELYRDDMLKIAATAVSGDTAVIQAGITIEMVNAHATEALQLIVLRGD